MEHDSLAVAKALGFTRKKELVAYYGEHPHVEKRIQDLKADCIDYFKSKLSLIIDSQEIKSFRKKFLEEETEEKEKLWLAKRKAEAARQKAEEDALREKIMAETIFSSQAKPCSQPLKNHVIDLDDDTTIDFSHTLGKEKDLKIAELESQLAETTRKLQKMEIERNKYRSLYKALKRRCKPIINKLLLHALQ